MITVAWINTPLPSYLCSNYLKPGAIISRRVSHSYRSFCGFCRDRGTPAKRYLWKREASTRSTKNAMRDVRMPEWIRTNRITLVSVINAEGDTASPLFVFRGKLLSYRKIVVDRHVAVQTYASRLPRGAAMALRDENGGVDGDNLVAWINVFVNDVRDLTTGNQKVCLFMTAIVRIWRYKF